MIVLTLVLTVLLISCIDQWSNGVLFLIDPSVILRTIEDARAYAERIDKFMNALEESIKNECTGNSKPN